MSEIYKVSAKTVDEAMDLAEKLYGGAKKELTYDIESLPKKGFLGIGSKDAVIRVTVNPIEDEIKLEKKAAPAKSTPSSQNAPKAAPKTDDGAKNAPRKAQNAKNAKPEQGVKADTAKNDTVKNTSAKAAAKTEQTKPAAKSEEISNNAASVKSESSEKAEAPRVARAPKNADKPKNAPAKAPAKAERVERDPDSEKKRAVSREEMDFAKSFIASVISDMHLNAAVEEVSAAEGEEFITSEGFDVYPAVNIVGEDTGVLIGHHGETLDALQYLVNLALYRSADSKGRARDNIKITVDIANYRAKREETLRSLAVRMANRAVKYKKNVFLEPMNPYERRIIHSELQDFPDVATHSVGSDVNRKIIITYEGADKQIQNKKRKTGRRAPQNKTAPAGGDKPSADIPAKKDFDSAPAVETPAGMPLPTLDDVEA